MKRNQRIGILSGIRRCEAPFTSCKVELTSVAEGRCPVNAGIRPADRQPSGARTAVGHRIDGQGQSPGARDGMTDGRGRRRARSGRRGWRNRRRCVPGPRRAGSTGRGPVEGAAPARGSATAEPSPPMRDRQGTAQRDRPAPPPPPVLPARNTLPCASGRVPARSRPV